MPRRQPHLAATGAFTLTELLVTVVAALTLASVAVVGISTFNRNEQTYSAGQELLGWLEGVAGNAITYGPCTVSFANLGNNLAPGTEIARVSAGDARCAPQNFTLPTSSMPLNFNVGVTFRPAAANTLVFTQRAGVVATGVEATVKIVSGNAAPVRCVRVAFASLTGGINTASSNVADNCTLWD